MKRLVCSGCGALWRRAQRKCTSCGNLTPIHAWPATARSIRDRFAQLKAAYEEGSPARDAKSIEEGLKDLY